MSLRVSRRLGFGAVGMAIVAAVLAVNFQRRPDTRGPWRLGEGRLSRAAAVGRPVERAGAVAVQRDATAHQLAIDELRLGRRDESLRHLSQALAEDRDDAAISNDIAVIDLAEGRIGDAAERLSALRQRNPDDPVVAFNWALALEKLSNRTAALAAWTDYLRLDGNTEWADEARARLRKLSERPPQSLWESDRDALSADRRPATIARAVQRHPQRIREWAETVLLHRWAQTRNAADLDLLRAIGQQRAATDPFLRDVVERAAPAGSELLSATGAFSAAQDGLLHRDFDLAAAKFTEAADLFTKLGSPMELHASLLSAQCEAQRGRVDVALATLDALDARLRVLPYPGIEAEAKWVRGVIHFMRGEWNDSTAVLREALAAAVRSGDVEDEIGLTTQLAANLDRLGEPEEAEQYRLKLLRRIDETGAPAPRVYVAFAEAARAYLRTGRPRVALAFVESQARLVEHPDDPQIKPGDPQLLAEINAKRAMGFRAIGRLADAREAIRAARSYGAAIRTEAPRQRVSSEVDYIDATLTLQSDPRTAAAMLSSALAVWEQRQWRTLTATGRLARAEANRRLGDLRAAEDDLRAGIEQVEGERSKIDEPAFAVSFFERADVLFERLIELLLDQGRTDEALSIAERKRSRALLDQIAQLGASKSMPLGAAEIAAAVPRDATLVEITMLDRGAAIWIIQRNQIRFARTRANRSEVAAAVDRHLAAIASGDEAAVKREGRWLFDQLLGTEVSLDHPLMLVPDGPLQTLPFATLVAPDGRYLIEHCAVANSPSASVFLQMPSADPRGGIVAVAQPAPDGFDPLPAAKGEVERIGSLYPRGQTLIGRAVASTDFLEAVRAAPSIHFAGHALLDVHRPSESALIFESSNGAAMKLTAGAIARAALPARPLVVLAACSTGRGKLRRNEGVEGLTSAFLRAGASRVVATLWNVDDDLSAPLFYSLHSEVRAHVRPSIALRDAQLMMLRGNDPRQRAPKAWGSAIIIGSL